MGNQTGRSVPTDTIVDAVLTASRVLVAVAARSLGEVADEVTMTRAMEGRREF